MKSRRKQVAGVVGILVMTAGAAACSSGDGNLGTPTSPTPNPGGGTSTITITAAGVSPSQITVSPGTRVTFTNNDSRPHEMNSDPHPEHTDCVEINQVGFLQPGQSRQTGNLNTVRTCGFHDHNQPDVTSLQGRITIQ